MVFVAGSLGGGGMMGSAVSVTVGVGVVVELDARIAISTARAPEITRSAAAIIRVR